jgi:outer membrane protein assembly factor BamB
MVPGSTRNWIAVNAVQTNQPQQKTKTKNMTTLQLRKSIVRSHLRSGLLLVPLAIATFGLTLIFNPVAASAAPLIVTADADTLWRQYGFNAAHTSFNNSETILNRSNVSQLKLLWSGTMFRPPATSPILGFNSIFVANDGRVRALQEQSGQRKWVRLSCSGEGTQQPALGHGLLLVGDGGGDLAAYEPATGQQIWCDDESGSITSAPAVADDTVYITNGTDAVAVDQATGLRRWTFTPADFSPLTQTPAIANGMVFITGGQAIFALDQATGHKIWRHNVLQVQAHISAPSVANGLVYVGGDSLYAFSAADGHLVWRNRDIGVNVTTPAIAENKVFVNAEDPNFGVFAVDAATGVILWNSGDEYESTLTVANGVVYSITDVGDLLMFDTRNGAFLGSIADPNGKPFFNGFGAQPIVANGIVYVSTDDRVDAFHLGP